jgi:hypothetical protein
MLFLSAWFEAKYGRRLMRIVRHRRRQVEAMGE